MPVMFAAMPVDEHMSRFRRVWHALHMPTPVLPWLGTCIVARTQAQQCAWPLADLFFQKHSTAEHIEIVTRRAGRMPAKSNRHR